MKILFFAFVLQLALFAGDLQYQELSKKIIKDLNYIYQEKSWTGGSTYAQGRKFTYRFKAISPYEIEIRRNIDGLCLEEPFIIDIRDEYWVELQADIKCDPALIISRDLDIIYLYVKDRCGHFGGFNLYKRAVDATVMLKGHFDEAYRLNK